MRSSGILMHLTSLPSPYGIGTMGACARQFVDFLRAAGQSLWQILPLGPTGYGDSPYQSFSTFAGNPYLIDLDELAAGGLLSPSDYNGLDWGDDPGRVDYGKLYQTRYPVLRKACKALLAGPAGDYRAFCERNAFWLEDYALFMAVKGACEGKPWTNWDPAVRDRDRAALRLLRENLAADLDFWRGTQYLFFRQWSALKRYANRQGVRIIGDLPIYVSADSADVWAHPEQFRLDGDRKPVEVAGCPPDGFSATGQLWGNPLFDWDFMERDGFAWWVHRVAWQFELCDVLRMDHFRGFEAYYAIPYGESTAKNGRWRPGPGIKLFRTLEQALGKKDIIAEDLGFLTPAVHRLREEAGFPGMKVLEFAFDSRDGEGPAYLPHNYPPDCVAYVGTHDNEPVMGWLATARPEDAAYARSYLHLDEGEGENWGMMEAVWASAAGWTVVQMQDVLGLGSEGRMNTPSTLGGNWAWRAPEGFDSPKLAARLRRQMERYGRLPK